MNILTSLARAAIAFGRSVRPGPPNIMTPTGLGWIQGVDATGLVHVQQITQSIASRSPRPWHPTELDARPGFPEVSQQLEWARRRAAALEGMEAVS